MRQAARVQNPATFTVSGETDTHHPSPTSTRSAPTIDAVASHVDTCTYTLWSSSLPVTLGFGGQLILTPTGPTQAELRPSTLAAWRTQLDKYLLPAFGDVRLSAIGVVRIEELRNQWLDRKIPRCTGGPGYSDLDTFWTPIWLRKACRTL